MLKISNFFKLYRAEMLFLGVSVLCTALAVYGAIRLNDWNAAVIVVGALLLLTYLGYQIQKLEIPLSHAMNVAWCCGYILYAASMIICLTVNYSGERVAYCSLLTFAGTAVFAMFGYLMIIGWRMDNHPEEIGPK